MTELTPTIRKSIEGLIKAKGENAMKALAEEVDIDPDAIMLRLLNEKGFPMSSGELYSEIRSLRSDRNDVDFDGDGIIDALREELENLEAQIEAEKSHRRSTYNRKIEELKSELRVKLSEMDSKENDRELELKEQIEARENALVEKEHPGLISSLQALEAQLPEVKAAERELTSKVHQISATVSTNRGRLTHLVRDRVVDTISRLLTVSTTEEAYALLENIPTVAEMIAIAEDPERGLASLVDRLQPSHRLKLMAPPQESEGSLADVVDAEVSHSTIEVTQ